MAFFPFQHKRSFCWNQSRVVFENACRVSSWLQFLAFWGKKESLIQGKPENFSFSAVALSDYIWICGHLIWGSNRSFEFQYKEGFTQKIISPSYWSDWLRQVIKYTSSMVFKIDVLTKWKSSKTRHFLQDFRWARKILQESCKKLIFFARILLFSARIVHYLEKSCKNCSKSLARFVWHND